MDEERFWRPRAGPQNDRHQNVLPCDVNLELIEKRTAIGWPSFVAG